MRLLEYLMRLLEYLMRFRLTVSVVKTKLLVAGSNLEGLHCTSVDSRCNLLVFGFFFCGYLWECGIRCAGKDW